MSADSVVLDQSLGEDVYVPEFVDKQYLYVNDSNNSNYASQIVLDTTSLSNSGAYLGWSESFLAIPLVLQMASTGMGAANVDFAMALKSGYWNIIHSMSVEFNNGSVVQQTPFLNVFTSFKCLTSWSDEDVKNHGKLTGFCPDSADGWLFNDAVQSGANPLSANGVGLCNNRTSQSFTQTIAEGYTTLPAVVTESTVAESSVEALQNKGLLQRMKWLNFSLTAGSNKSALLARDAQGLQEIFKAFVRTAADSRAIVFPAIVRMKDVCDFFDKMPLLKGATMRLYINTNQSYLQLQALNSVQTAATGVLTAGGNLALRAPPVLLGGGGTCPIMVASAGIGQGLQGRVPPAAAATAVNDIQVAVSIVRTQFSEIAPQISAPITSVRLYCPTYTMTPSAEAKYLSLMPTKKIVYEDIFQYSIPAVQSQNTFNVLVSNGLPNLKSLVLMGFLPKSSNGVEGGAGNFAGSQSSSSLLSPFSSSGATPDPVALSQFNVQLSGKNLFNQNKQYDYESFVEQLSQSNQLNGGKTTGMASGLIGQHEFENLYRYYYADCSRGLPGESGVSRSIQIQGKNMSDKTVDYVVFASYTREILIDLRSGDRLA